MKHQKGGGQMPPPAPHKIRLWGGIISTSSLTKKGEGKNLSTKRRITSVEIP